MKRPISVPFERQQLDNGLILFFSDQQRLPLLSLNAFVLAGSDQNPLSRPGLGALTSHLLDEGTRNYNARQIAELVEIAGGNLSSFSHSALSGISLQLREEDCRVGLDLMKEMICSPRFSQDLFELQKDKVINHIQALADDPFIVARNQFDRWIYRDGPLQHPILGTEESLQGLKLEDLFEFHRQKYAPENTILVVVGAADWSSVMASVNENFSSWKNPDFRRTVLPTLQRQSEPILDQQFMAKEQLVILVGHLGISRHNPDFYALQILDMILGSGPGLTSRIPRKLRDEQGLAYAAYSDITASSGIYPGRFVAYASTSPENGTKALTSILREIESVIEDGVTKEELITAQEFLTGNFVFDFQTYVGIAHFLLNTELFKLGTDYLAEYPETIRGISCGEVKRVAEKYLDAINCTTIVVGPTDTKLG